MCQSPEEALRRLSRFVATSNPFYVISAALVLYGLNKAIATGSGVDDWTLMIVLCGYTSLLAISGLLIIRIARVWDDARMLLLLLVLMFFAISVCFDESTLRDLNNATTVLLFGLGFSVGTSELVLRLCGIQLARRYRFPYYAVLTLLFVYPLVLGELSILGHNRAMSWGVWAFPSACGAVFLTLLPATFKGGRDEPPHGTPWPWPFYPWSLFFFLALGVLLRSYSLSMVFEAGAGSGVSFRPYFVIPFLAVISFLWLQLAHASGSRRISKVPLFAPLLLFAMALPGPITDDLAGQFLETFCSNFASPIQVTACALIVFYGVAVLQRIRWAETGLSAAVLVAASTNSATLSLDTFVLPRALPIELLAVFQCVRSGWRRSTVGLMFGVILAVWATCFRGQDTFYMALGGYIPIHLAILACLAIGLLFDDRAGRLMRRAAAWLIPAIAMMCIVVDGFAFPDLPPVMRSVMPNLLFLIAIGYWFNLRTPRHLVGVLASAFVCLFAELERGYRLLAESTLAASASWIVWGMIALAVALATTFSKSGLLSRLYLRITVWNRVLDQRWRRVP